MLPLAEQKQLVAKVDELVALCDELEAKATGAREVGERLAAATVHGFAAA